MAARALAGLSGIAIAIAFLPEPSAQDGPPTIPGFDRTAFVGPGQGPQEPYVEQDWEYWWYLNHEPLIDLRRRIAALGRLPPTPAQTEAARERLLGVLDDDHGDLQAAALIALAKLRGPVLKPIKEALEDRNLTVREHAILALGILGGDEASDVLQEVVFDERRENGLRTRAAVAMGLAGGDLAETIFEVLLEPNAEGFHGLPFFLQNGVAIGAGLTREPALAPLIVELLRSRASNKGGSVKSISCGYLAGALGRLRNPIAREALLELLKDDDVHVRRSAMLALGELLAGSQDEVAVKTIHRAQMREPDQMVELFASVAMGKIGGSRAAAAASDALGDRQTRLREPQVAFAALALAMTRHPAALQKLGFAFEKAAHVKQRAALAIALGLLGDANAAGALRERRRTTKNPILVSYLNLALGMIGDPKAVPALRADLADGLNMELLPRTAIALALIDPALASESLLKRIANETSQQALQPLLYSLGLVGDREALEPMIAMVADPRRSVGVRVHAAIALGDLCDPRPQRTLAGLNAGFDYTAEQHHLIGMLIVR